MAIIYAVWLDQISGSADPVLVTLNGKRWVEVESLISDPRHVQDTRGDERHESAHR
jgi:hypothetical protein